MTILEDLISLGSKCLSIKFDKYETDLPSYYYNTMFYDVEHEVPSKEEYEKNLLRIIRILSEIQFYYELSSFSITLLGAPIPEAIERLKEKILTIPDGLEEYELDRCEQDLVENAKEVLIREGEENIIYRCYRSEPPQLSEQLEHLEVVKVRYEEALEEARTVDESLGLARESLTGVIQFRLKIIDTLNGILNHDPLGVERFASFSDSVKANAIRLSTTNMTEILSYYSLSFPMVNGLVTSLFRDLSTSKKDAIVSSARQMLSALHCISIFITFKGFVFPSDLQLNINKNIDFITALLSGKHQEMLSNEVVLGVVRCYQSVKANINGARINKLKDERVKELQANCLAFLSNRVQVLRASEDPMIADFFTCVGGIIEEARRDVARDAPAYKKVAFIEPYRIDPGSVAYIETNVGLISVPEEQWPIVDEIIACRDASLSPNFKIRKKEYPRLSNSFLVCDGVAYAVASGRALGVGGEAKVKIVQDREGNNKIVKIHPKATGIRAHLVKNERDILKILGRFRGGFRRVIENEYRSFAKEYTFEDVEFGAEVGVGFAETGIIANEKIANEVAIKCIEAIMHLHSLNIIHRDIKPDNFMMFIRGGKIEVVIVDFGLSARLLPGQDHGAALGLDGLHRAADEESGEPYREIKSAYGGTMGYMADEAFSGGVYSKKTDTLSLGCLLLGTLGIDIPSMRDDLPMNRPALEEVRDYLIISNNMNQYEAPGNFSEYRFLSEEGRARLLDEAKSRERDTAVEYNFDLMLRRAINQYELVTRDVGAGAAAAPTSSGALSEELQGDSFRGIKRRIARLL